MLPEACAQRLLSVAHYLPGRLRPYGARAETVTERPHEAVMYSKAPALFLRESPLGKSPLMQSLSQSPRQSPLRESFRLSPQALSQSLREPPLRESFRLSPQALSQSLREPPPQQEPSPWRGERTLEEGVRWQWVQPPSQFCQVSHAAAQAQSQLRQVSLHGTHAHAPARA
jgi:hypothetical protein